MTAAGTRHARPWVEVNGAEHAPVPAAGAPRRLPFGRPSVLCMAPGYREAQRSGRIVRVRTPVGDPAWLVTRYGHVQSLFGDDRLGRSHPDPDHAPRPWDAALLGRPLANFATEQEDHARLRRIYSRQFTPDRVKALRPRLQGLG